MGWLLADLPKRALPGQRMSQTRSQPSRVIPIREQGQQGGDCASCSLNDEPLEHGKMKPSGSDDPLIYILGEAPSKQDDEEGLQFAGNTGTYLRNLIPEALEEHIRWNNTVRCRPPGNRAPSAAEMVCCSAYQEEDIYRTKPLVVMGFGAIPLKWAIDEAQITPWRGLMFPINVRGYVCWYAPLWHPSYVVRSQKDDRRGEEIEVFFKRDLERVFTKVMAGELDEPVMPAGEDLDAGLHWELATGKGVMASKPSDVAEFLAHLAESVGPDLIVDLETKGLRPYAAGNKILSIAFGTWDLAYAIPLRHRETPWSASQIDEVYQIVAEFMTRRDLTFYAHHLKFEMEWLCSEPALGPEFLFEVNWGDTMAMVYVLNNSHSQSLNSRSIVYAGIPVKQLDTLNKQRMDEEPLAKVLKYNARDCKFTDVIRQEQTAELQREGLWEAYQAIVDRVLALVLAQHFGLTPNYPAAAQQHEALYSEAQAIEAKIQALPDVISFVRDYGEFNSASNPQLTTLLKDRLKLQEGWRKVDGHDKYSTDEDALKEMDHPIAPLILEKRSIEKMDSTYVLGVCEPGRYENKDCGKHVWADGLIHTDYSYSRLNSSRSSSEGPNVQNYPKHEHKEIRDVICAPAGHIIVSVDYGQIQYRIIGMASGCPVILQSLWDKYDIHGDWAARISADFSYVFDRYEKRLKKDHIEPTEKALLKAFRQDIKNKWTFPLFFGSVLEACARDLDLPAKQLKPHFEEFWRVFAAVREWQKKLLADYRQTGYVETLAGWRRYGPLTDNEAINTPIQGTEAAIVFERQEALCHHAYKTGQWHFVPRINLHDDLTFYIPTTSLETDIPVIGEIMCQPAFPFVNCPIIVDISVGETWGSMEELYTIESIDYGYPAQAQARRR